MHRLPGICREECAVGLAPVSGPGAMLSIGSEKGLIRSLGAARGGVGCAGAHSVSISEFMLSRVQAPSAPRACRLGG